MADDKSRKSAEHAKTDALRTFLVSLATDAAKLGKFVKDPDTAMEEAGLNPTDQATLKSGNSAAIYARLAGVSGTSGTAPLVLVVDVVRSEGGGETLRISSGSPTQTGGAFPVWPNFPQQVWPQIYPQIHPQQIWPQIHPQIVHPQIWPQIHPQIVHPQIWPQIYPQIHPQIWPQIFPQIQPNIAAQAYPPIHPQVVVHPQIHPQVVVHPQIHPQVVVHPQIHPQVVVHPQIWPQIQTAYGNPYGSWY